MFGKVKRKILDKIESLEIDGVFVGVEDGVFDGFVSRGVDLFLWDY